MSKNSFLTFQHLGEIEGYTSYFPFMLLPFQGASWGWHVSQGDALGYKMEGFQPIINAGAP